MNKFVETQIKNMTTTAELFQSSCELATKQDDGITNKAEAKILKRIKKATDTYLKELERILKDNRGFIDLSGLHDIIKKT